MTAYDRVWSTVCTSLTVVGLSLGVVLRPGPLTVVAGFVAVLAVLGSWVRLWDTEDGSPSWSQARAVARPVLTGGAVAGALVGLSALLGAGVVLLLLAALGSSPYAVRATRRWVSSSRGPSSPGELTDEELSTTARTPRPVAVAGASRAASRRAPRPAG